ncbi:nickel insertion protein, partial [Staphylococcus epidermidis]|uniref:nickel insertion protein n=1 Tax=Staphylococcus epidermidis TaxID=1282 RepID=UPI0021B2C39D
MTPQPLRHFMNNPLQQPPLHPYYTPIFIKKSPPTTHLTLISTLHHNIYFQQLILQQTTSLPLTSTSVNTNILNP